MAPHVEETVSSIRLEEAVNIVTRHDGNIGKLLEKVIVAKKTSEETPTMAEMTPLDRLMQLQKPNYTATIINGENGNTNQILLSSGFSLPPDGEHKKGEIWPYRVEQAEITNVISWHRHNPKELSVISAISGKYLFYYHNYEVHTHISPSKNESELNVRVIMQIRERNPFIIRRWFENFLNRHVNKFLMGKLEAYGISDIDVRAETFGVIDTAKEAIKVRWMKRQSRSDHPLTKPDVFNQYTVSYPLTRYNRRPA
ncbi:MAG: hypothetical protein Q8N99_07575 [Nanoarchaeota archaeon]|nr:hypothetical protein [Nanoarchaeota archaeon]